MVRCRSLIAVAVACAAALAALPASGATPAQYGAKCAAAWPGAKNTAAFRAYRPKCVTAATRATSNATDAGNPTSAAANTARSRVACGRGFPTPRNTAAKRAAFAACVSAASVAQRAFAGRPLHATLRGANEVPAAGGATGTAIIRLNQGKRRVCYTISVAGLGGSPVVAAHIHQGAAGVSGPPVIGLTNLGALDNGKPATGCVQNVDAALIGSIRQNPGGFYLNVHTVQFAGGAARGQLAK